MKITFLGTNGWYDTLAGNTICTLVETNKFNIIFDAGNGIYKLNQYLNFNKPTILFISHLHIDHIEGLHILGSFSKLSKLDIYVFEDYVSKLRYLLSHPFTMPIKDLPTKVTIHGIKEGEYTKPFPFTVKALTHVDPTLGFRIKTEGKIITYCCDTGICKNAELLSQKADILIHESSYLEKQPNIKWGHASPEEVAALSVKAGVKKLVLTHFAANLYTTIKLKKYAAKKAQKIFQNTISALDDMTIEV
ncbi:hypothetical protein A3F03_00185 [Candidatus Roizmanbacteria bacterium RIFCSPHIGHO2_12_FULL_41_11]|uniref:Metallo-beta-lactamase domain-containing protein n=3 Tax=Candidatus Roizmaniibacteriota TaxID=1752723 RepID=A0A1F7JRP9_9BACT|nr:MAG: hypothetical protein A3F03_00185 [Candidatus Roizmanbacteria bacterium RIFCSPHIGHO2_12_FULL_41_11]OGK52384.1 MAG: hypothetical protein A2966_01815 [Candidatus Roizmanbacteria bacterium RIFCSPLOWO2_01_FULL_41_22]OGK58283.1 MAG: hypothetical protein A3H86_01460 [Candidatus Roizmanbacteria bacterium RIFCSPLOWO2_02_FULL_41_9]